jgi:CBS domain-containing protein
MKTVEQLLELKGSDIWSIMPDASVYDAIVMMAERQVGALLVMREERLVGILSERDYARKIILKELRSRDTRVEEIMTTEVVYAEPEHTIDQCMALMTDKRIRHLPVMRGEILLGMVSIGDLVKTTIAEQGHTIEQLERYISQ